MQERLKEKKKKKKVVEPPEKFEFSADKIEAMKTLAQQIAKSISKKEEPKKTAVQLEIEEERFKKLEEKEKLKTLTPIELREWNRKKLVKSNDDVNKIDDLDTNVSFSKALEVTEKTAHLYNKVKNKKEIEKEVESYSKIVQEIAKNKQKAKNHNTIVDKSGKVDGEVIEGVIKKEIKKSSSKKSERQNNLSQDDYVLNKLFNKKGVLENFSFFVLYISVYF